MIDCKVYSQVSYIINNMSEELKRKIPKDLINVIEKNKDNDYEIEVEDIEELDLLEDTQKVLSVIYTDYIASDEEKLIIKNKEKIINLKREEEKKKKYDVNVLKKQSEEQRVKLNKQSEIIVIKKEKWYITVLKKIKDLIKNK